MDDATRARLDDARTRVRRVAVSLASYSGDVGRQFLDDLRALEAEYDALLTERAQAAPVLAAADQWASGANPDADKTALFRAVVAWRAAREG